MTGDGYFFDKTKTFNVENIPLPSTNWNQNMKILGIPYGTSHYIKDHWKSIVIDVKNLLHTYNDVYTTFDAKSIIYYNKIFNFA